MRDRLRRLTIPGFVLLCLLLGGSGQGIWRTMVLQLLAVGLICWAALSRSGPSASRAFRTFVLLAAAALLLSVLQLIPLPPGLWSSLPGREILTDGFSRLGYPQPWLPVSMAPYDTLATSLTILPPLAVLLAMARLAAHEESWVAGAVIAGALISVLLGAVQVVGGKGPEGWWYLYDFTNAGAVGFFANKNHMASLLLAAVPFAAALIASGKPATKARGRGAGMLAIGTGGFLLLLIGLGLNRSLAGIALAFPVIAASALLLPAGWRLRGPVLAATAITFVLALAALVASPLQADLATAELASSASPRQIIWGVSWQAVSDSFPVGTGFGSFDQIYPLYEQAAEAGRTYVNHAHNDYLELVLEGGLPAILLLAGFFAWWLVQAFRVWRSPLSSHFARAATIASAALLAHSLVDYPLRTTAMAAVFAACLAMMAQPPRIRRTDEPSDLRPTRHVSIG